MNMTNLSDTSIVTAASHQVSCDLAGETVILNMANGVYYGLNEVGARIWSLLAEPRTVSEIQHLLIEEYDVDAETCARHVHALISDLFDKQLVDVRM